MSVNVSFPVLVPVAFGENVTEEVQLACAARVFGDSGQVDVKPKSLMLLTILVMVNEIL